MRARHLGGFAVAAFFTVSSLAAATADVRLIEAAKNQDQATAVSLVKYGEGVNVNATDAEGMTALLWAAHWDNLELAKLLIGAGANVKAANRFGSTALHEAATFGDAQLMEALIKAGADPNATRGEGDTPLMIAAGTGKVDAVKVLLDHGVPVDVRDGWYGETPLMLAVNNNYADVAKVLIDHGADVNASSTKFDFRRRQMVDATLIINPWMGGLTPLMFAARQNALESAKVLVAAGANVNTGETGDGYTPLTTAIINNNYEFATWLVEKGANVNDGALPAIELMRNGSAVADGNDGHVLQVPPPDSLKLMKLILTHEGVKADLPFNKRDLFNRTGAPRFATAFYIAAAYVDVPGMRMLLENGAHPVAQRNGTTPLMAVAQFSRDDRPTPDAAYLDAVKLCIGAGNDINAANTDGNTALHYAAGAGNDALVQYLVEHGANLNAKTTRGRTPLDWAKGKRPGGLGGGFREEEAPQDSTIALLQKLMSANAGTTAQNTRSPQP